MGVRSGLVALLKDLNAKGEGHLICERVYDERQAVGLIGQAEGCNLLQASLECSACHSRKAL